MQKEYDYMKSNVRKCTGVISGEFPGTIERGEK